MPIVRYSGRWLLVLAWMTIIFAVSHQANSGRVTEEYLGTYNVPIRKLGHLAEYFVLYFLIWWALNVPGILREKNLSGVINSVVLKAQILPFILTVLYAVSDEWHQGFVAGRSSSAGDVLIDATGALLAVVVAVVANRTRDA